MEMGIEINPYVIEVERIGIFRFTVLQEAYPNLLTKDGNGIRIPDALIELIIGGGLDELSNSVELGIHDVKTAKNILERYGWIRGFEDALKNGFLIADPIVLANAAIFEILKWYLSNRNPFRTSP